MNKFYNILKSPETNNKLNIYKEENLKTIDGKEIFIINNQIPILFGKRTKIDDKIITWWTDLYKQLYEKYDSSLDIVSLKKSLEEFEDLMRKQDHLITSEMLKEKINNKICLEIGSGSGAHSALMKYHGADVISCDISLDRCISTKKKLDLLNERESFVINCNAQELPIQDNVLDYVYSNGVLHHAENTNKCISEVNRVLKPNGKAVLMLYCRQSAEYYLNILPKAIIKGSIFKHNEEPRWVGEVTEGKTKYSDTSNPITRVYNKSEIINLFSTFEILSLRKHYFSYKDFSIPRLTQIREAVLKIFGSEYHKGGEIVYGKPIVPLTFIEKKLSKYLGFFWYIVIKKK